MTSATRAKRRPVRGEARRDVIVDAALAVISRVGPDALTHRLVAAEAGLPVAATTYWFSSKEDIVVAAFEHAVARDLERVDEHRVACRRWTRDTLAFELAGIVEDACAAGRARAVVGYALWVEAIRRPELQPIAQRWIDAYTGFLLEALVGAGARDARPEHAQLLNAAIDGVISQQLVSEAPVPRASVKALLQPLVDALLR